MEGERSEDEKMALMARITTLEGEWDRQQGEEHVLTGQLKRLQDDLRRINRQLEKGQGEKATLEEKIGQWRGQRLSRCGQYTYMCNVTTLYMYCT